MTQSPIDARKNRIHIEFYDTFRGTTREVGVLYEVPAIAHEYLSAAGYSIQCETLLSSDGQRVWMIGNRKRSALDDIGRTHNTNAR